MSLHILWVDMDRLPQETRDLVQTIADVEIKRRAEKAVDSILGIETERDPAPLVAFFEAHHSEPSVN